MSQLCNMNYMFQTPSVLKTRGKKEGKPSPNLKPGAIPWCSSCSFLIAIPFIVQATHFTTRYLPHLSSAMHNCLCWYFHGQHLSSPVQMRLSSKQQSLKRNFYRPEDLSARIFHRGNLLNSKEKTPSNILMFCHFDNKVPKTKQKEYWFHYCHNWKSPCPDGALWTMDSASLLLLWIWQEEWQEKFEKQHSL